MGEPQSRVLLWGVGSPSSWGPPETREGHVSALISEA